MTEIVQDLTAREAHAEFVRIGQTVGMRAEIWISLDAKGALFGDKKPLSAALYPQGLGGSHNAAFRIDGETFRELVAAVEAKWSDFSDEHTRRLVSSMALEIIRITAEMGRCTDAALRADKFSPGDVARYGSLAAEKANEMASNGPFSVVAIGGNGEHIEDEEAA